MRSKQQGFTLVEIMIALMILTLLASISYPTYQKSRSSARRAVCKNNLKQIAAEADLYLYEVENKDTVTLKDIAPRFKNGSIPTCPSGGTYTLNMGADPFAFCDHGDDHEL